MSQITTLSRPSGSKAAYKPWQKEEVERLIGWIEEHIDMTHGKQSEWTKRAKEEVFSLDDHISTNKIRDKARNMRTAYNKAKQMQLRSGWGLAKEDVEQSIHDRLEKICQFFWRLDGIWGGQKPDTTPLSQLDALRLRAEAPDITIDTISPSPVPRPSRAPSLLNTQAAGSSRHGSQSALPGASPRPGIELTDNDESDQDTPSVSRRSEYYPTSHARKSASSLAGPNLTENLKLLEAQSAQREKLLDKRLQHEREMHAATLSSQERVAEIMAASSERTMQAVLSAFTSYRRRSGSSGSPARRYRRHSDSSRRTRSRSRSASPARREA